MARERIKRVVEGTEYEFYQLPVGESVRIIKIVTKIMGILLTKLKGSLSELQNFMDMELSDMGEMLTAISDGVTDEELDKVVHSILKYTYISNGPDRFVEVQPDIHFSGQIDLMFKVVLKGLQVNYPFLEKKLNKGKEKEEAKEEIAESKK